MSIILIIFVDFKKDENVKATPLNTTYYISGKPFTMVDGISEIPSDASSSSKIITRYFGNGVSLDLDFDSYFDEVFLITQETGGSGTFFYMVAAINKNDGYVGSQAVFIGDRISPQNITITENNTIAVNYVDRKPGENFSVKPSIGKTLYFKYDPKDMSFGELVQNFEGEVDKSTWCKSNNGVWFDDDKTCEVNSLSKEECLSKGWEFNECASACRHDSEAKICTMQCVITCSFK